MRKTPPTNPAGCRGPGAKGPEPPRKGASLKALKALIAERYDLLPACRLPMGRTGAADSGGLREQDRLFREAMADVRPMAGNRHLCPRRRPAAAQPCADSEGLQRLRDLIARGEGFVVAQTPEYMEGAGRDVPASLLRRLHRGDFSIEGHLDMHGLTVRQARPVFDAFLREALTRGQRAILVIHGRGLSSPRVPVLKARVAAWLSTGPWRKWVIAFASARPCDGGAGATYVLLRRRPAPRRRGPGKNLSPGERRIRPSGVDADRHWAGETRRCHRERREDAGG